jgi:hypothetical protein
MRVVLLMDPLPRRSRCGKGAWFSISLTLLVGLVAACTKDEPCPTCLNGGVKPIPIVSGVWNLSYDRFISGGLGITKDLVLELDQVDSSAFGWMGGTITSCLNGFGCFTEILYVAPVLGSVRSDSVVALRWFEDTTQVSLQGHAEPNRLAGTGADFSWEAVRATRLSISQAKQTSGDTTVVRGVVTVSAGLFEGGTFYPGNVVYVQDGSAGIEVVGLFPSVPIDRGDSVLIRGVVGQDGYGERAIIPINVSISGVDPRPPEAARLGLGTVPPPLAMTVTGIMARTYEGSLATVRGVRLVSKPSSATGGYPLTFVDSTGASLGVIVHSGVATSVTLPSWIVGAIYDLTGILGRSNGTPNLQLRGTEDRVIH